MTELEKALGKSDQDVMDFQKGVAGLAFEGFTDDQIAKFAIEEAQTYRRELNKELSKAGLGAAFPTVNNGEGQK